MRKAGLVWSNISLEAAGRLCDTFTATMVIPCSQKTLLPEEEQNRAGLGRLPMRIWRLSQVVTRLVIKAELRGWFGRFRGGGVVATFPLERHGTPRHKKLYLQLVWSVALPPPE